MYSYTLTFREEADKLTAPEHEIRLQSPAQAGLAETRQVLD